jgi:hypothetical protein
LAVTLIASCVDAQEPARQLDFIKGFSWGWTGMRSEYEGKRPEESMQLLAETGTEWIALCFAAHMPAKDSPEILYGELDPAMVSDEEVLRAIRLARENDLKIIMKPVVNCFDGTWRAEIDFQEDGGWEKWWRNYQAFLLHYARIAAQSECEMFCVGCEMRSTESMEGRWRRVLREIRTVYDGPLVYNANHGDIDRVQWFDAVDVIGVSAYYSVATEDDTSLKRMLTGWKPIRERMRRSSGKWDKPILFMEIGMRSAATCSTKPWDWHDHDLPYDGEEQARYYQAAFQTFWDEPWFLGFCWWDWKAQLYEREQAATDTGFGIFGKPAEAVLREWYHRSRDPEVDRLRPNSANR